MGYAYGPAARGSSSMELPDRPTGFHKQFRPQYALGIAVLFIQRLERMYHYDPVVALEEVNEDALLPHPVHMRDMMLRAHLSPDRALELNKKFQSYLEAFGEAQKMAQSLLKNLADSGNS